jgi:hypothetical protein
MRRRAPIKPQSQEGSALWMRSALRGSQAEVLEQPPLLIIHYLGDLWLKMAITFNPQPSVVRQNKI